MKPITAKNKAEGLTAAEAEARLVQDGPNELPSQKKGNVWHVTAEVMKEPMFFLLLGCGSLYMILGDYREGIVMLCSIAVIIGITFYQYRKTQNALQALKALSVPEIRARRDGKIVSVPGRNLVVGDVILLSEGERVPADLVVLEESLFTVDESVLTGESVPVVKRCTNGPGRFLWNGTLIVAGHGKACIIATGVRTKFGLIGTSLMGVHNEQTSLQKEMKHFIRNLFFIGTALCIAIIVAFYIATGDFMDALLNGFAAAMAIVPEEFSVVMTVFLALGAWRLSRMNVLVRKPSAVEALGAVTVLCTDKTGTITQNHMEIASLYRPGKRIEKKNWADEKNRTLLQTAALASANESRDPMEHAIRRMARRLFPIEEEHPVVREYPLSGECFAMTNVVATGSGATACCKGAPETVLRLCRLDPAMEQTFLSEAANMAASGLRVLAVAKAGPVKTIPDRQEAFGFGFLGLIGFEDPVRPEVKDAVDQCTQAGVRLLMITGDFPETAKNIASQIGFRTTKTATGKQLDAWDEQTLRYAIKDIDIFARVVPEQKLRIVRALKANGEIAAMTGDGINDVLALKTADVGLAMGKRGTEVAREAASIVLTDDNFASIVNAIRCGRKIYDNLQKAMSYMLAVHIPIIVLALLPALFSGLPPFLLPLHIIFLELIIDPVSSIVFESEQEENNIMKRPPRDAAQPFFGVKRILPSIAKGILTCLIALAVYLAALKAGVSTDRARTEAFITLVLSNIFLTVSTLSSTRSFLAVLREKNAAAVVVLSVAVLCLCASIALPGMRRLFRFELPGYSGILQSAAAALLYLFLLEGVKWAGLKSRRLRGKRWAIEKMD